MGILQTLEQMHYPCRSVCCGLGRDTCEGTCSISNFLSHETLNPHHERVQLTKGEKSGNWTCFYSFSKKEAAERWGRLWGSPLWLQSRRVEFAQRGGRQAGSTQEGFGQSLHCRHHHQKHPAMTGQGVGCGEPGAPFSRYYTFPWI